jgi:hypothetical protein
VLDLYDLVYEILKSDDLIEVSRQLKLIDEGLTNKTIDRSRYCKKLAQAVSEWSLFSRLESVFEDKKPDYYIHPPNRSVSLYLATHGLTSGKVREMRKNIKTLISNIDNEIIKPTGNYLTVDNGEKTLSILSDKFPYWKTVSPNAAIDILIMKNSHRLYNSLCGTDDNYKKFVVYMFNMKDDSLRPEYVFLHELGHLLQMALTGSVLIVPDEFINFHNSTQYEKLEQGNPDAAEVFADIFAIAVMRGTVLSDFYPFSFPDVLNERFEKFFNELFNKYSVAIPE